MKTKLIIIITFMVVGINTSYATLNTELTKLFDDAMIGTNPSGQFSGQQRNYIIAGGAAIHFPSVQKNLIGFNPPSITAGCGGVDAFGGSFSFVNKDEFVQLLRNVGANASGYMFQLALEGMCPTCSKLMKDLQATIQKINKDLGDSCRMAKFLVDRSGVGGALESHRFKMDTESSNTGVEPDIFASSYDKLPFTEEADAIGKKDEVLRNVAWKAIRDAGLTTWEWNLGTGPETIDEDIAIIAMNLTGTWVLEENAGHTAEEDDVKWRYYAPTISFNKFMMGKDVDNDVEIFHCKVVGTPEYATCLVKPKSDDATWWKKFDASEWDGFYPMIRDIIVGTAPGEGLIQKFRLKNATLTSQETALISALPTSILTQLRNLSREPTVAEAYAQRMAQRIAFQLTLEFTDKLFSAMESVIGNADPDDVQRMEERIREVRIAYRTEYTLMSEKLAEESRELRVYEYLNKKIDEMKQIK